MKLLGTGDEKDFFRIIHHPGSYVHSAAIPFSISPKTMLKISMINCTCVTQKLTQTYMYLNHKYAKKLFKCPAFLFECLYDQQAYSCPKPSQKCGVAVAVAALYIYHHFYIISCFCTFCDPYIFIFNVFNSCIYIFIYAESSMRSLHASWPPLRTLFWALLLLFGIASAIAVLWWFGKF